MSTPVKDRIRAAAIIYGALPVLLGTSPFRWYDRQMVPGSVFPAVQVQVVSDPASYVYAGRLPTSWSRYQFTLSGVNTEAGVTALVALEAEMMSFFDSLNLIGVNNLSQYPNLVVAARDGFKPAPSPGIPQRILDVMIFANSNL